jgi:predicted acetyltransferase
MPRLVPPTTEVRESFLAAMLEFRAEGRGVPTDQTAVSHEIQTFGGTWGTPAGFASYVERLRADALEESPRREGWVPSTNLWYVEGNEYYGRLAIRHRLTPFLRDIGGHIGYDVRRSARRRGYATRMLREALPIARGLGIDSVLVTCDLDNVASRKVIEANGGVLEDPRGGKLRFWIPAGPVAPDAR